jgi:MFS family permease
MLTAQFGTAALMVSLGLARQYWQIAALTLVLGAFNEAVRPAFSAMMVDIVPDRDRVRAFSLTYWAINLGFALAAVGAGLAAKADYLLLFLIDAGTTLITAVISLIFLAETRPQDRPAGHPRATAGGLRTVLRDRVFLSFNLVSLGTIIVMMQHQSTLPIAMTEQGFSAATYGWVIAINGVLIVLGQLFIPKLIEGRARHRVLAAAALVMGTGFGLVAVAGTAWLLALTVVIWTVGEMLQSPSSAATVAALSPVALRGRYQGMNSLTWSAGSALAPVVGGLTQQHLGGMALWIGCFVLCALAAVGHLIAGPSRERRAARLAAPAPAVIDDPVATG